VAAAQTAAVAAAATLLPAGLAQAAEAAPDGFLELLIKTIDALGPWGPAAFVATVAVCECIPLFPTQASKQALAAYVSAARRLPPGCPPGCLAGA
jgi:hypothetical protein